MVLIKSGRQNHYNLKAVGETAQINFVTCQSRSNPSEMNRPFTSTHSFSLTEKESDDKLNSIQALPGSLNLVKSMFTVIPQYPSGLFNPREEASSSQLGRVPSFPVSVPCSRDSLCYGCWCPTVTTRSAFLSSDNSDLGVFLSIIEKI